MVTSWLKTRVSVSNTTNNKTTKEKLSANHRTGTLAERSIRSLVFETFYCFLLLVSELFKVTTDLRLHNHLPPAFPRGILSLPFLGPVLYCPQSSSLKKVFTRQRSFGVTSQDFDCFLQLVSPLSQLKPMTKYGRKQTERLHLKDPLLMKYSINKCIIVFK